MLFQLHGLYGECSTCGGDEKCIDFFVGKHERKRPLGGPRRRREDNIKMDPREIGLDWIRVAQDRDR
jgi:hypothetical protein